MKKRILAVMLTLCLLICSMAVPAGAQTENDNESVSVIVGMVNYEYLTVGDCVDIPIYLNEVKYGYGAVEFDLIFDSADLEFKECTLSTNMNDKGSYHLVYINTNKNQKGGYDKPFAVATFEVKRSLVKPSVVTVGNAHIAIYVDASSHNFESPKSIDVGNGGFYSPFNFSFGNVNTSALSVGSKIEIPVYLSEWKYGYSESTFLVKYDKSLLRYEGKRGFGLNSTTDETTGEVHFKYDVGTFCGGADKELGYLYFSIIDQITNNSKIELNIKDLKIYTSESALSEFKTDLIKTESGIIAKPKYLDVIDKINSIGEVTIYSESIISEARSAYDALSDGAKALVSNYNVLTSAEQRLAQIKADKAAAENVVQKINDIGTVTLYSESVIYDARRAYNALSDEAKGYVTNYSVLLTAEKELTALKDKAAAREVTDKINAIGTVTTEKENLIISARKAYDSLTDTQKNMVSNYQTLLQAEAQLEVIKSDKSAVDLVIGKILAIGKVTLESEDVITAARAAYDALTNEQKLSVTNYNVLLTAEATLQTIKQDADPGLRVVEKINQIGEVTLESGQLIQQARNAYDQLTTTQKSYVNNYDVLVAAETKYAQLKAYQDAIDDTINKINAIGEVTYQSGDAISAARNAFDALDYAQKAKIYNLETLLVAEIKYRDIKANYDAAVPVIEAIAQIENMNIDLDSGDTISSVRAKYDALSEEQKAYVSNYSVLTDAEAYFGAINDVYTKIRDIGKVTLEKISAVEQAREAYDALTTEQKDKITNYTVLVVSENSVLVLTCDKNKAEQVSEKIDEIENLPEADEQKPEISDENYEDIKARLDALEKLIDELIKKFATVEKDGKETVDEQKAEIVKETFYSEKVEKLKQAVEVYESVAVKYGDVNGDGKINTDDALLILQYVVGLSTIDGNGAKAADVNGDGRIDTNDALGILQYVVNIRTELPFEID